MARILIVDDERNMRRTLADIFRDDGFEVETAETGEQALRICSRHDFDVVLMDVRMPGIDGVEAFRRLRRRHIDVPVVMMSAYSVEHLQAQALREGVSAFVAKPLDPNRLLELIRESLPGRTLERKPS